MKKLLSLLLIVLATCTIAMAQDSTSSKIKHAKTKQGVAKQGKKDKMQQLNLSKEQQTKIKASKKKYRFEAQKIKRDSTMNADQKKAKIKQLQKEEKKQVDTVLTASQKNKLKELRKKPKTNSPQNGKPSPKTPGTAKR